MPLANTATPSIADRAGSPNDRMLKAYPNTAGWRFYGAAAQRGLMPSQLGWVG